MRLRAGLITNSPVWEMLLAQEGFPWKVIESPEEIDVKDFSVLIADEGIDETWDEPVRSYITGGGAAVVSQDDFARWVDGGNRWEKYRYLVPKDGSSLKYCRPVDIPGKALVHDKGGELLTDKGSMVLPLLPFGRGTIASLPFDIEPHLTDNRGKRKLFPSPVTPRPTERVSRVPKGGMRQVIRSLLAALHHSRGLYHVHLWYFPGTLNGIFGLRIDTDHSVREEVQGLYSLLEEYDIHATWFLHVKAHIGWIRDFASMKGQEIGVHCYAHYVYGTSGFTRQGIAKARDILLGAGLDPAGFAAPYGIWSDDLSVDLEDLGFIYSSEFGFDYDNLPSLPWIKGGFSNVLQLPIHPISPGSLVSVGYPEADMVRYFETVMERKRYRQEPLFFYTHPGDGHFDLLRKIFERIDRESVRAVTFTEYADWWRERDRILEAMEIIIEGDEIEIRSDHDGTSGEIRAAVVKPGGERALIPVGDRTNLSSLDWIEEERPLLDVGDEKSPYGQKTRRLLEDIRTYFWRRRG